MTGWELFVKGVMSGPVYAPPVIDDPVPKEHPNEWYLCSGCGLTKHASEFYRARRPGRERQYKSRCKTCCNAGNTARRAARKK